MSKNIKKHAGTEYGEWTIKCSMKGCKSRFELSGDMHLIIKGEVTIYCEKHKLPLVIASGPEYFGIAKAKK